MSEFEFSGSRKSADTVEVEFAARPEPEHIQHPCEVAVSGGVEQYTDTSVQGGKFSLFTLKASKH